MRRGGAAIKAPPQKIACQACPASLQPERIRAGVPIKYAVQVRITTAWLPFAVSAKLPDERTSRASLRDHMRAAGHHAATTS